MSLPVHCSETVLLNSTEQWIWQQPCQVHQMDPCDSTPRVHILCIMQPERSCTQHRRQRTGERRMNALCSPVHHSGPRGGRGGIKTLTQSTSDSGWLQG